MEDLEVLAGGMGVCKFVNVLVLLLLPLLLLLLYVYGLLDLFHQPYQTHSGKVRV
jgi:hypothetical protein